MLELSSACKSCHTWVQSSEVWLSPTHQTSLESTSSCGLARAAAAATNQFLPVLPEVGLVNPGRGKQVLPAHMQSDLGQVGQSEKGGEGAQQAVQPERYHHS